MESACDSMSDDDFVSAFEKCELPNEVFRHREHVRLTFIYLRRYGYEVAGARTSEAIRRYALHNGAPQKYHETITRAWLRIVQAATTSVREGTSFEEMLEAYPDLLNKGTLTKYYSDEVLGSERARGSFAEPDREALPDLIEGGPRDTGDANHCVFLVLKAVAYNDAISEARRKIPD